MPSDAIENPWLNAFLAEPWQEIILGQVLIRRVGSGFELRHVQDSKLEALRPIRAGKARAVANFTSSGSFRALKSTRDLPGGWILKVDSAPDLETALQSFYPNAVADWFAEKNETPPVTDYRTFTKRQTGMYRITTFLNDTQAGEVVRKVCDAICLKRRLWSVGNFPFDGPGAKSIIPCLEPCAVFLEAARVEVRRLQESSARAGQAENAEPAT